MKGAADKNGNRNKQTSVNEIGEWGMDEVLKIILQQWDYEQFPMYNQFGNFFLYPKGLHQLTQGNTLGIKHEKSNLKGFRKIGSYGDG